MNSNRTSKIIIVGAGVAGLFAASKLLKSGFEVTILEATERQGGRVRELNGFGDFPIMLGAEHVQGRRDPAETPLSFLNVDIGTQNPSILVSGDSAKSGYVLDGAWVWSNHFDTDVDVAKAFLLRSPSPYRLDWSVAEYLGSLGINNNSRAWHLYEAWIGAEYGASIERINMKGWETERNRRFTGDTSWLLKDSFLAVLDRLYFDIARDHIRFNTMVTRIDYSSESISLTARNCNCFSCDAVLITVPLSILQNDRIAFIPALPESKKRAISGIGFGKGMKMILKFSEMFWPESMYECVLQNYISFVWSSGKYFPCATNNILTAYIAGASYDRLYSLDGSMIRAVLGELDAVFGGCLASEKFVDAYVADWGAEESFQGVYSYPIATTYTEDGVNCRQLLAQPVADRIFFAGEATSSEHAATVHGALETGERAASEIIASFRQPR